MSEFLMMLLTALPALAVFVGYLYAADKLDTVVRTRYPGEWNKIAGDWDAHSSSNAFVLLKERKSLTSLNDAEVSRLIALINYLIVAFVLSLVFAYLMSSLVVP